MKTRLLLIPFSLLFSVAAHADVFVMKDGTRLEGTILREEGTNYVLEVKVTKSIRDEKTVAKADVVRIEKEKKDLDDFENIKKLVPTPDLLRTEEYSSRIAAVENYIKLYPTSPKKKEAEGLLATLKTEASAVAAGGIKMNGAIVDASAYRANAYDIDAGRQAATLKAASARRDYLTALRAYDVLEKDFKDSAAYKESVPLVTQMLVAYEAQLKAADTTMAARLKEQKAGLDRMAPADRLNATNAIAAQNAEVEARYQKEKADKQNWVTVDPNHKASISDALRASMAARNKLNSYKPSAKDPGQAYRDAVQAIEARDKKVMTSTLSAAKSAKIPARYLDPLAAQAKVIEGELVAEEAKAKADAEAARAAEKEAKEKPEKPKTTAPSKEPAAAE